MWNSPYVIIRPLGKGLAKVAHEIPDLKRATYVLQYVAEPGDALFNTPKHPKNKGSEPEYAYHIVQRGKFIYSKAEWLKQFCDDQELKILSEAELSLNSETA